MSIAMLVTMLVCFAFSISVAVSIGLAASFGLAIADPRGMILVPKEMFSALDKFPLAAIPFFILAGNLMETGGISQRLVDFARSLVGGIQGGLPMTCVLTCMIFAAVSGSSVATTFAIGAILIPALIRQGYPPSYAAALQATSAELGVVIPPSIPMILFGVAAEVSIGELFIAGVLPGLFIGATLMLFVHIFCRIKGWGLNDGVGRAPVLRATASAGWALLMPVVILGGIYGGIFTPTEAAAVAVLYALVVGMFLHRELRPRDIPAILRKSVMSSAVIMFIIANAGVFAYLITRAGVPEALGAWLTEVLQTPALFLLGINAALFVIGMFIETSAAIIVLAPILAPVAMHFGIDPVHLGIIMVVNLALGMITPPFGVNLFAACAVARISLNHIIRHLLSFVLVILACLMVITYVPSMSLVLRDAMYTKPELPGPGVGAPTAPSAAPPGAVGPSSGGNSGIGPSPAVDTGIGPSPAGDTGIGPSPAGDTGIGPSPAGDMGIGPSPAGDMGIGPSPAGNMGIGPSPAGDMGIGPSPAPSPGNGQ